MTTLTPYLLFEGKCRQAMDFYQACFDGELTATEVKDTPQRTTYQPPCTTKSSTHDYEAASWRSPRPTGCGPIKLPFAATRFVCSWVEEHSMS